MEFYTLVYIWRGFEPYFVKDCNPLFDLDSIYSSESNILYSILIFFLKSIIQYFNRENTSLKFENINLKKIFWKFIPINSKGYNKEYLVSKGLATK